MAGKLKALAKKVGRGIKNTATLDNLHKVLQAGGSNKIPLIRAVLGRRNTDLDYEREGGVGRARVRGANTTGRASSESTNASDEGRQNLESQHNEAERRANAAQSTELQEQMLAKLTSIDTNIQNLVVSQTESNRIASSQASGANAGDGSGVGGLLAGAGGLLAGAASRTKIGGKILGGLSKVGGKIARPVMSLLGIGGAAGVTNAITSAAPEVASTVAQTGTRTAGTTAARTGAGAAVRSGGRSLGKSILKKIPIIGLLAGVGFGLARAAKGDFVGASMEVASGAASTLPGLGTATSVGIDAALLGRDVIKSNEVNESTDLTNSQITNNTETTRINDRIVTQPQANVGQPNNGAYTKNFSRYNTNQSSVNSNIGMMPITNEYSNIQRDNLTNEYSNIQRNDLYSNDLSLGDQLQSVNHPISNVNNSSNIKTFNNNTDMSRVDATRSIVSTRSPVGQVAYNALSIPTAPPQPIIIPQPIPIHTGGGGGSQIQTKSGTSGSNAPLLLATFDKSISALSINFMSKSIPYYG